MNKTELLNSLTPAQKIELDNDIIQLAQIAGKEYNFDPDKLAEVNTNMRLQDDIYLNVTLKFHISKSGEVTGEITQLKRFATIDEYLDSINKANNPDDGFTKLKTK